MEKTKNYSSPEYQKWRQIQRDQLSISSTLFFTFTSVLFGFTTNFLLTHDMQCPCIKSVLIVGAFFSIISIFLFSCFTVVRLYDYRQTAKLYANSKTVDEVTKETYSIGQTTWYLFIAQIICCGLSVCFTLFAFYLLLY
jgi:hypothetical protein